MSVLFGMGNQQLRGIPVPAIELRLGRKSSLPELAGRSSTAGLISATSTFLEDNFGRSAAVPEPASVVLLVVGLTLLVVRFTTVQGRIARFGTR
jgi:hypothetical protein